MAYHSVLPSGLPSNMHLGASSDTAIDECLADAVGGGPDSGTWSGESFDDDSTVAESSGYSETTAAVLLVHSE